MSEFAGLSHNEQKILVLLLDGELILSRIRERIVSLDGRSYASWIGTYKNLNHLKEKGLVTKRIEGRKRPYKLTEKGRVVSSLLKKLKKEVRK